MVLGAEMFSAICHLIFHRHDPRAAVQYNGAGNAQQRAISDKMPLVGSKEERSTECADGDDGGTTSDLLGSLALIPSILDKYETRFLGVEQSQLYKPAGAIVPKLPMYHPYHPFRRVTNDDILQVPLAVLLPNTKLVPRALLERAEELKIDGVPTAAYYVAQTLPYEPETEVICRHQYCLFPDAECEMRGHRSIWARSAIYRGGDDGGGGEGLQLLAEIPATEIKIYESEKDTVSPTILCGDSMRLDTVENLRGKGIWSLVTGSASSDFVEVSHCFIGYTRFLGEDEYDGFVRGLEDKSPAELVDYIPALYVRHAVREEKLEAR